MVAGVSYNAHRLARVLGPKGKAVAPWWSCTARGCSWHPKWPADEFGRAEAQFRAHLYDLVPKRGGEHDR